MAESFTFVFADTEVAAVESRVDGLHLRCAAAHVRRRDAAGTLLAGWSRGVELRLSAPRVLEGPADCFGRVAHGRVRHGDRWSSTLALPGEQHGAVRLELAFANGASLVVEGSSLDCRHGGAPDFAESLFC